jgi:MinD superfamily P-loop ATPase
MKTVITIETYQELSEDYCGLCDACGSVQGRVEPDATNYACEACGACEVHGADEYLINGNVE